MIRDDLMIRATIAALDAINKSEANFGREGVFATVQDGVVAALHVLREPSEAMLDAARDWSYAKYGKPVGNDGAIGCWQAMLDALAHKIMN